MRNLVRAQAEGQGITAAEEAPQATNVVDLMALLQGSLDQAQGSREKEPPAAQQRKTAARKAPPKAARAPTATRGQSWDRSELRQ
ncbi:hypothetical protein [Streptomyces sp. NPDC059744]|uniref:hypothetical protein n=1 Tax=Streptomyces sp. NPDC059744 TaxID=3346929 RepID=UPI00364BC9D6